MSRLVCVLVVEEAAGVAVAAVANVARKDSLLFNRVSIGTRRRPVAHVDRQLLCRNERLLALFAPPTFGSGAPLRASLCIGVPADVRGQLFPQPETLSTFHAGMSFIRKMSAQVVLQC